MARLAYIYALIDPREPNLYRYIGWTMYPQKRLENHIEEARSKRGIKTHKTDWIRKIVLEGYTPNMVLLEECTEEICREQEKLWISKIRSTGHRLTNGTDGGDGLVGYHHSEEARNNIRQSRLGKPHPCLSHKVSESTKQKLRISSMGNKNAAGYKHTPEAKRKMKSNHNRSKKNKQGQGQLSLPLFETSGN